MIGRGEGRQDCRDVQQPSRFSGTYLQFPFLASCLRDRAIIDRDPSKELLTPITNALVSERLRAGLTAHRMHDTNGHESKMRKARTPRGSPQNRPMRITSKPANGTESGQAHLYLVRTASDNGFSAAGMTGHILTNTWAEDRAPQGCDPSADPEAGMAGRRPSRPPGF